MIKSTVKFTFAIIFMAISTIAIAQKGIDTNFLYKTDVNTEDTLGQVIYHQSEELTSILRKNIVVNEAKKSFRGYRIQIFSVSGVNSKDKANKARAELLMDNPDIQVYLVYIEPYFKVRVGDFLTKLDALYFLQSILKDYPFAFVVADNINYPTIENEEVNIKNN